MAPRVSFSLPVTSVMQHGLLTPRLLSLLPYRLLSSHRDPLLFLLYCNLKCQCHTPPPFPSRAPTFTPALPSAGNAVPQTAVSSLPHCILVFPQKPFPIHTYPLPQFRHSSCLIQRGDLSPSLSHGHPPPQETRGVTQWRTRSSLSIFSCLSFCMGWSL